MEITTAMIFAAGLGTRLRPYTNDRPKALVEVGGMTLLEIQVRRLAHYGVQKIVVNIHHFAELMEREVEKLRGIGPELVISDERNELLETGGGLLKAKELLQGDGPILVVNVDILTDLDYGLLSAQMARTNALAVLAVRNRETSRYLIWNAAHRLVGWRNQKTGEIRGEHPSEASLLAFSGIQLLHPHFLDLITETGKFSIIDTYLRLAPDHPIYAVPHDDSHWLDVGKPHNLDFAREHAWEKMVLGGG